jgi:hypothetical protein
MPKSLYLRGTNELSGAPSYYAGDSDLPGSATLDTDKGELESALLNQVNADGVGITASLDIKPDTITLVVTLDPHTLSLKDGPSGSAGKVEEAFLELDDGGKTLGRISDTKTFLVDRADRASFDKGVTFPQSIPLTPGAARITIIVRDSNTGHIGSLNVPLQKPPQPPGQ